jgi:hypothetical protein
LPDDNRCETTEVGEEGKWRELALPERTKNAAGIMGEQKEEE